MSIRMIPFRDSHCHSFWFSNSIDLHLSLSAICIGYTHVLAQGRSTNLFMIELAECFGFDLGHLCHPSVTKRARRRNGLGKAWLGLNCIFCL